MSANIPATSTANVTMSANAEAPITATAGLPWDDVSNNETTSPIENDNRADDKTPPEIRFLHDHDDEYQLRKQKVKNDYETPSSNSDPEQDIDYGHATIDSEARHQILMDKKKAILRKLLEQANQKKENDLLNEISQLENQLESNNAQVIDLIDNGPSTSSMTSVTTATTTSHVSSSYNNETQVSQPLALLDYGRLVTLSGTITYEMATRFFNQSKQADFKLGWQSVIMADSLALIRLRVATSYAQMKITKQDARAWDPSLLNAKEMGNLVYQLYGSQQRTETSVQIENAINQFNFGFDLDNKQTEETSHQNVCKLITDHYGPLDLIPSDIQDQIAKLLYRKVPNNSELNRTFKDQTKLDIILTNGKDTIENCLNRYIDAIQQTRAIHILAAAHKIENNRFFSGATIERQSTTSSKDTTISYGNTTHSTFSTAVPKDMSRKTMPHDTDFHEGMRTVRNRCETCGKTNHLRDTCVLFGNRMCNNTSTMWHFSKVGRAWYEQDHHCFIRGIEIPGYGLSEWSQEGPPPRGYVYPHEPNTTGELQQRESQLLKDSKDWSVALYSAYRTYVPYSLSPFWILNPDTVTVVMSSPASHRYRCFLV